MPTQTLICSDWYNAAYDNAGTLTDQGKPDRLNIETLARRDPNAAIYSVPDHVYDDVLNGAGYPTRLADFPLDRCTRLR